MKASKELLTYCGFYCGDCLGYTGVVADAAEDLKKVLDRYQFVRTAHNVFPKQLEDYDKFYKMLGFMTSLRCPGICRREEGEGPSSCGVRDCCREKGFFACYECDGFETCDKLWSLHGGIHTDSCMKNMKAIRAMGLETWLAQGQRSCYWLENDASTSGSPERR